MAHDDQNGSFEHKVGPPASYCPNKNSRKLGFIRHHFEKISVSTLWTFFQVQRPAANAANTFSGARKKWRCVSTALTLLQVHCPDSAPSLRGLNTKAPLSPSIRRTFCPQITLLRQVYVESKGIFGCNIKSPLLPSIRRTFFKPSPTCCALQVTSILCTHFQFLPDTGLFQDAYKRFLST